ncbi:toll/interleukin-1 receptor domain-containing protein [Labilibaculum sp.]|uniref:toll/interleukin-1 receptor domain-containing protein n=1 Tax=Labilibaculum sp. TaxID=2060723 RepID=UPI002AA6CA07|nr:toll/interleukin-1 receptor domain-containing protein [Labilibaculum sp.]
MRYKYQLILIGTKTDLFDRFLNLFFEKTKELSLLKDAFSVITEENFDGEYKSYQPAFTIYFGDEKSEFVSLSLIDILLNDGRMILPIYYEENSFSKHIPPVLFNQNGLLYDVTKDIKVVNLALEAFKLLRSTRKVFVSYKRSESSSVAIQLYEELEKNNFDVFLDTHSIKQGEPFQDELWHRMTDCDVIVLLNTKGFLNSHWCKEELAEASAKQIGVIQLVWPGHTLDSTAHVSFPFHLTEDDFKLKIFNDNSTSKLQETFVEKLIEQVESVRARNLRSRQDNLITEFTNLGKKKGKNLNLQPHRFITEDLGENKRRIFIPLVGIPQSINCNQSAELQKEINEFEVESIHLLYDDMRIRDKWINHLDWLNKYLEVKTIKKQEFESWLQAN